MVNWLLAPCHIHMNDRRSVMQNTGSKHRLIDTINAWFDFDWLGQGFVVVVPIMRMLIWRHLFAYIVYCRHVQNGLVAFSGCHKTMSLFCLSKTLHNLSYNATGPLALIVGPNKVKCITGARLSFSFFCGCGQICRSQNGQPRGLWTCSGRQCAPSR